MDAAVVVSEAMGLLIVVCVHLPHSEAHVAALYPLVARAESAS